MLFGLDNILCCNNVFDTIRYGDVAGWAVLSKLFVICAADDVYLNYEYLSPLQACFMHVSKSLLKLRYRRSKVAVNLTAR
jgi:hypothetical protein